MCLSGYRRTGHKRPLHLRQMPGRLAQNIQEHLLVYNFIRTAINTELSYAVLALPHPKAPECQPFYKKREFKEIFTRFKSEQKFTECGQ